MTARLFLCVLFFSSAHVFAETKDFDIGGNYSRVGGNGSNILFVQNSVKIYKILVPNIHFYNSCEKYFLMKMDKKYKYVRLVNFLSVRESEVNKLVEFTLGEDSFCLLEAAPEKP